MSDFEKNIQNLGVWLSNFKEAIDAYPKISGMYDELLKYKGLFDKIPESESEIRLKIEANFLKPTSSFISSLGPEPKVDLESLDYSKISISTGVTASLSVINDYAADDPDWYKSFKSDTYQLVRSIDSEKELIEKVNDHLERLEHAISKDFKELVDLYNSSKTDVGLISSLGIKMRNLLEHFKGICNKAAIINRDGEHKGQSTLTWQKITENIALNGPRSRYANDLYKLIPTYNSLWSILSSEAKDYTSDDSGQLSESFYITIKFLSDFFDLADFEKIEKGVQ